ncbi:hypothetical protein BATDEDRAFT_28449 [Batrachochytrium dendrobatidis JAM81]|uniref:Uncharacterized protein n=1 Tax=Batrachochytrium dendrobatidis (strain JAM81 / FGSC 10211) TaxID=684364 RepID=F4PE63_BATDJ|nr:uncharacterized protein BATDEDRAFT_28449 [Batrachochytrium dendrobatidis JAM81]EGF76598.1 hypothetical protein BATDEDRAFT_28449 [Batrachochytrium dendrobatidis JAM81]|eukprot:XP_006682818.1 hypothetical protein BATDEDRAFT_28449 [Batrachochytrium dendrobatidis JAM81]
MRVLTYRIGKQQKVELLFQTFIFSSNGCIPPTTTYIPYLVQFRHLSDFFIKTNQEPLKVLKALILQAHVKIKALLWENSVQSSNCISTISTESYGLDFGDKTRCAKETTLSNERSFPSCILSLNSATNIAIESKSLIGIQNIAQSFIRLHHLTGMHMTEQSFELLNRIALSASTVLLDNSNQNQDWRIIIHLLLANHLICRDPAESHSMANIADAKKNIILASHIWKSGKGSVNLFLAGMQAILKVSPEVTSLLEPRWASNTTLKVVALIDKIKKHQASTALIDKDTLLELTQLSEELSMPENESDFDKLKETTEISLPIDPIRLFLVKECAKHHLYTEAAKLLARIGTRHADAHLTLQCEIYTAQVNFCLLESSAFDESQISTPVANSLSRISKTIEAALAMKLESVALEGCIVAWSILWSIIDDRNRHSIVSILCQYCKYLTQITTPKDSIKFLFEYELCKCYESMNLLKLAKVHAQLAAKEHSSCAHQFESHMAVNRIEAKLHCMSSSLGSEYKALILIDRARTATNAEESVYFLQQAIQSIIQDYKRGDFISKLKESAYASVKNDTGVLVMVVLVEIMREAKRWAVDISNLASHFLETYSISKIHKLNSDIWEMVFVTTSQIIAFKANSKDINHLLLAEVYDLRGQSITFGIYCFIQSIDLCSQVKAAVNDYFAAIDSGIAIGQTWMLYNSTSNIWNLFATLSNYRTKYDCVFERWSEFWVDIFQVLFDKISNSSIAEHSLFAYLCSAYSSSLLETHIAQVFEQSKGKTKPLGKDAFALIKTAEDIVKTGAATKNADYNSLFVIVASWCKIASYKATASLPVSSLDIDDPLLRLFISIDIGQQGTTAAVKSARDTDPSILEHTLSSVFQISYIPDVFRIEMLLQIGKQSLAVNQHSITAVCAQTSLLYLDRFSVIPLKLTASLQHWLIQSRMIAYQLTMAIKDSIVCRLKIDYDNAIIPILAIKEMHTSGNTLNFAMDKDYEIIQNLFSTAIDIAIGNRKIQLGLRLADMGLRVLQGHPQNEIWIRKGLVLTSQGMGSSLLPLKDNNVENQAQAWMRFADLQISADKKRLAVTAGLKLLVAKHLTHTWTYRLLEIRLDSVAGNSSIETKNIALPFETTYNQYTNEFAMAKIEQCLKNIQCIDRASQLERLKIAQSWASVYLPSLFCCKPSPSEQEKKESHSSAKTKKSKEVCSDTVTMPTMDKWHQFVWPAYLRAEYINHAGHDHISNSNLKDPLALCGLLLQLIHELVRVQDLQATHPIFCLLELISELSVQSIPDLYPTILLYFAVTLSCQGMETSAKEKYILATSSQYRQRTDKQATLVSKSLGSNLATKLSIEDILLLKSECHVYFGDHLEAEYLTCQNIHICHDKANYSVLSSTYGLGAVVALFDEDYERARYMASVGAKIGIENDIGIPLSTALSWSISIINQKYSDSMYSDVLQAISILDSFDTLSSLKPYISNETRYCAISAKLWLLSNLSIILPNSSEKSDHESVKNRFLLAYQEVLQKYNSIFDQNMQMELQCRFLKFLVQNKIKYIRAWSVLHQHLEHIQTAAIEFDKTAEACQRLASCRLLVLLADVDIMSTMHSWLTLKRMLSFMDISNFESTKWHGITEETQPDQHLALNDLIYSKIELQALTLDADVNSKLDYYLGLRSYSQIAWQFDTSVDQRKQVCQTIITRLSDNVESFIIDSEFQKASIACEALLNMSIYLDDDTQGFRYLSALQTCESLPEIHQTVSMESTPPIQVDFTFPFKYIPNRSLANYHCYEEQFKAKNKQMFFPSVLQNPEWPKDNIKIIIFQHSNDKHVLHVYVLTRYRDIGYAKLDRKKTPADEMVHEIEAIHYANPLFNDILNNGDAQNCKRTTEQAESYLLSLLSKFKPDNGVSDLPPAIPTSQQNQRAKSSNKEVGETLQSNITSDDQHVYLILDHVMEKFNIESAVQKYYCQATSITRDLNLSILLSRFKARDSQSKSQVMESPKKKDKALDFDKDKSAAINYIISSNNVRAKTIMQDSISRSTLKTSGLWSQDILLDEFSELMQRGSNFIYCGPPLLQTNDYLRHVELKLSGVVIIFEFDHNAGNKAQYPTKSFKELAIWLTVRGASTIIVPRKPLSERLAVDLASELLKLNLSKGIGGCLFHKPLSFPDDQHASNTLMPNALCCYGIDTCY